MTVSIDTNTRIETFTGLLFDFERPEPDQVCIDDVAHSLSQVCRYGGHITHTYSVAQHALLVRRLVRSHFDRPDLGYAALHHDSAEAYTGDVMRPMKNAMGATFNDAFSVVEDKVERAVCAHFGISIDALRHEIVKEADVVALRMEAAVLKVNDGRTFAEASGVEPIQPLAGVGDLRLAMEVEEEFHKTHQNELINLTKGDA